MKAFATSPTFGCTGVAVSCCETTTRRMRSGKGTKLATVSGMDCFCGSYEIAQEEGLDKSAVVTFNIPDAGIRFKAPFAAVDAEHGHLAALLALLEFIDSNQKYFPRQTYQIYSNNLKIVNGVNQRELLDDKFSSLLDKALTYRRKYHYSLEWIPIGENPAYDSLFD